MFCCICYENELFIHSAQAYNEEYKPDAEYAMLLPCGHILGHVCLQAWKEDCQVNENPYTCPVCRLELEPPRCPRHKVPEAINLARPLPSSSRTRLWLRNFILSGTEPERTPNQYPTEGDKYQGKISKDCHYCFEERRPDWKAQFEASCKEWIAKGFFSPWSPEQIESDWHTDFEYDPDDEFDWGDRYVYLPRAAKAQDRGDGEQLAKRRKLSEDALK